MILERARETLRDELQRRKSRNSKYSLRAFARDLGISPSHLSDLIRGRRKLSKYTAHYLSEKLNPNAETNPEAPPKKPDV